MKGSSKNLKIKRKGIVQMLGTLAVEHLQIVSQETRKLCKHYTSILVIFVWLIQIFSIRGTLRLGLEFLAASTITAKLFMVLSIATPLIIMMLAIYFIVIQSMIKKHLYETVNKRFFRNTTVFRLYIGLLRFNFFIVEPLATGYQLSLILTRSLKYSLRDEVGLVASNLMIIPTIIGFGQSILYAVFIESILPNNHILSCSNNVNFFMINLAIKVGILLDAATVYVHYRGMNKMILLALVIARNCSSFIAIYWSLSKSYYFHPKGRLISICLHSSFVGISLLSYIGYLRIPQVADEYLLVPGLVFGSLSLKLIMNLIKKYKTDDLDPDKCSLVMILRIAHNCYMTFTCNDDDKINTESIRIHVQIKTYLGKQSNEFEAFRVSYTSMSQEPEEYNFDFVMFLFHKFIQRDKNHSLKALLFQGYYMNQMGIKLHLMASVVAAMRRLHTGIFMKNQVQCLRAMVSHSLNDLYTNRISLNHRDAKFYRDRREKQGWQAREGDSLLTRHGGVYSAFDVHSCLVREYLREVMTIEMNSVLEQLIVMYQQVARKTLPILGAHHISKYTLDVAESVRNLFQKIEYSACLGALNPTSHLLPYAMFVDTVLNQRLEMSKTIKLHRERTSLIFRNLQRNGSISGVLNFQLDRMVAMSVSAQPDKLGDLLYYTKNIEDILSEGVIRTGNISDFFSDSFKRVHTDLVANFILKQDLDYLGSQNERFVRTDGFGHYEHVTSLVKLGPVLCNVGDMIFCCLLNKILSSHCYLFVSALGRIIGFNWNLKHLYPKIEVYLDRDVGELSMDLKSLVEQEILFATKVALGNRMEDGKIENEAEINDNSVYHANNLLKVPESLNPDRSIDSMLSIALNNHQQELNISNHIQVGVQQVKPLEIGQRILLADIVVKISANSLANLSKEKESSSITSKKVYVNSPARLHDTQLNERPQAATKYIKVNSQGNIGRIQSLPEERIALQPRSVRQVNTDRAGESRSKFGVNIKHRQLELNHNLVPELSLDNQSSSTGSINFKHRVFTIINRQKRYFVWRELVMIVVVQCLVWSAAVYITVVLDQNYNIQMKNAIEIRKGVRFFALGNAKVVSTAAAYFEYMFEKKGILNKDRYRHVLPRLSRDWIIEGNRQFRAAEHYSLMLIEHIYSFEATYANRYLQYNATYTTEIGPNLNQTFTGNYDVNDMYYMAFASLRRWRLSIDRLDFNDTNIREFYEIINVGILSKIGVLILNRLIDSDVEVYTNLTFQTTTTVIVSIVCSLLFANAIIVLVLVIRNKMIYVYSAFRKLYDYEIFMQIDFLNRILNGLKLSLKSGNDFENNFIAYLREQKTKIPVINENRKRKPSTRMSNVYKLICGECFGLASFISLSFVLMQAYNVTIYLEHVKIKGQTDEKLMLMANYRNVFSGSASVTFGMLRMLAYVIHNNKLGLQDLNETGVPALASTSNVAIETYYGLVDGFVQSVRKGDDSNKIGGFDTFLKDPPCKFVDLDAYNLTLAGCEKLGDQTMGRNVITVFRWMEFTLPVVLGLITTANATDKYDVLNDILFTELNTVKTIFLVPFTEAFSEQFFVRIYAYHQYTVDLIRSSLTAYLIVSIITSIIINMIGYRYTSRQAAISLSSFHLLPSDSAKTNPQVGMILHSMR